MRRLGRWLLRLVGALVVFVLLLLAPSAYVEVACRGEAVTQVEGQLPAEHWRAEARTLLTYPEWHIVHAYEDYARVIAAGDPHDYGFLRGIAGFWSSFCALSRAADALGADDGGSRQTVHVIGVSFTAELLMKAAYEETLGRVTTWVRGETRASLDDLSATQAAEYATFLQQVPWYRWDFARDAAALDTASTGGFRDRERRLALGLEYRAKAVYAGVIEQAVAGVGPDALTLRMIVTGLGAPPEGVVVIEERPEGTVVETPRYRALTLLLAEMAATGATFVEIAGNDDILFTTISDAPAAGPGVIASLPRQGAGDMRNLHLVKVPDLAAHLRGLGENGLTLEHIHDY
ncbi:MAG: hypothetical protein WBA67_09340 [Jannaschia sp.]